MSDDHRQKIAELEGDLYFALKQDHGHTTTAESNQCKTCGRRAALMLHVVERWLIQSGFIRETDNTGNDREALKMALTDGYWKLTGFRVTWEHIGPLMDAILDAGFSRSSGVADTTALDPEHLEDVNLRNYSIAPSKSLPLDPQPYYVVEDESHHTIKEIARSAGMGDYGGILYNLAVWKPREGYEQHRTKYPEEQQ